MITTKQISENIVARLQASISKSIPLLPKSFSRVLAKALAGVLVLVYKYAGFMSLQPFSQTAANEEIEINGKTINPLVFIGRLFGVGDPVAATRAELLVSVNVTTQTGSLPAGSQLVSSANGVTYLSLDGALLNSPSVQIQVRAVSDQSGSSGFGVIGNLNTGDTLSFVSPLPNIEREAVVLSQVVTAAEPEETEQYRTRVQDRMQKRPQGGAYADYEQWGEETSGIINVYPYTGLPGQVDIYSEATPESSQSEDGIPTSAQLDAVKESIELNRAGKATRRNVNTFVNSLAITREAFDVSVVGISGVTNLAQVREDIDAAIKEYFRSVEPFIHGLHRLPRRDKISRTRISAIVEDIVTAAGGTFSNANFSLPGTSSLLSVYVLQEGQKAKASVRFI